MGDTLVMRRTGVIVGLLFIVATAFLFLGEFFYKPYLDRPDVLSVAMVMALWFIFRGFDFSMTDAGATRAHGVTN